MGALRYTFELTDVAVKLLLGTKYQPVLFLMYVFKIMFKFSNTFYSVINAFICLDGLKVMIIFFTWEVFPAVFYFNDIALLLRLLNVTIF